MNKRFQVETSADTTPIPPVGSTFAPPAKNLARNNGNSRQEPERPACQSRAPEEHFDLIAARTRYGWRGWVRAFRIARVLGTLSFYLYLDGYDARSKFMAKLASSRLEAARDEGGLIAYLRQLGLYLNGRALDRFVRVLRLIVFRGRHGSSGREARLGGQAEWLKQSLIKLGPTFIKIGQSLATRADLLPLAYIKELSTLQDQVPAFSNEQAFARIQIELGRSLKESFAEIDTTPIAAASLGQVYRARLHTGQEVAVKVQRPNLAEIVSFDIAVLYRLVTLIERFPRVAENADWEGMLREFTRTIFEEMDYVLEAKNAERFRNNFKTWRAIYVPGVYWSHTSTGVLTLEFISGTKVTDIGALRARGISPVKVNRLLVKTYLKQLLEDGFFHADPHPGNLLVMDRGRLAYFDFGMTGRITPRLQAMMIDAFFHVVERDLKGVSQDLINLDFLKPGVDPESVRKVVENLFRHYLNLKLGDINFKELTYELADVVYKYPFRLPANFTYIMRALMTLEGIAIVTDPGFSLFEVARPYAKEFMLRREGKNFRRLLVDKLTRRENSARIQWSRMWKLAKMAAQTYLPPAR